MQASRISQGNGLSDFKISSARFVDSGIYRPIIAPQPRCHQYRKEIMFAHMPSSHRTDCMKQTDHNRAHSEQAASRHQAHRLKARTKKHSPERNNRKTRQPLRTPRGTSKKADSMSALVRSWEPVTGIESCNRPITISLRHRCATLASEFG